jgi:hypothetical protein
VDFQSKEEMYFSWYLDELKDAGYIKKWHYQFPTYPLADTISVPVVKYTPSGKLSKNQKPRTLLQPASYTCDFCIDWTNKAKYLLFEPIDAIQTWRPVFFADYILEIDCYRSYVDVKAVFTRRDSDAAKFSLLQKWVWQNYETYIQKVVPAHLFEHTFTPKRYLITDKTKKARTIKYDTITLQKYIEVKNVELDKLPD